MASRSERAFRVVPVSSAWAGWIEGEGRLRRLNDACLEEITPQVFSGRWSPFRSFPPELDPLPAVAGLALSRAGWFRPGSGRPCEGGLVVGADGAFLGPSARFAAAIAERDPARISPSDFILSFPSTAASLLTKLYGLSDYQATRVEGRFSGVKALSHALDLLATSRLTRLLVAALSLSMDGASSARVAAALCLESTAVGNGWEIEVHRAPGDGRADRERGCGDRFEELRRFGELSTIPLARLSMALEEGRTPVEIDCGLERTGARVYVSARGGDSQKG